MKIIIVLYNDVNITGGSKMTLDELLEYIDRINFLFQDLTANYGKAAERFAMDLLEGLVSEEEIKKCLTENMSLHYTICQVI